MQGSESGARSWQAGRGPGALLLLGARGPPQPRPCLALGHAALLQRQGLQAFLPAQEPAAAPRLPSRACLLPSSLLELGAGLQLAGSALAAARAPSSLAAQGSPGALAPLLCLLLGQPLRKSQAAAPSCKQLAPPAPEEAEAARSSLPLACQGKKSSRRPSTAGAGPCSSKRAPGSPRRSGAGAGRSAPPRRLLGLGSLQAGAPFGALR